ncbi:hypothetical protein MMC14_009871, partial [Varicellaria rhodocarpa]|nr:hypothetical protein [Varicellaria rhodocarpa]
LAFLRIITPRRRDHRLIYGLVSIVLIWAVSGEFAVAFQCRLPEAWNYQTETCDNRKAFGTYFEVLNIIIDAGLILVPGLIISGLRVTLQKKVSVLMFFSFRFLAITASIIKLVFWNLVADKLNDPTYDTWKVQCCTQIIQCLEVVLPCLLYARPFFERLQSDFISLGDMRRRGQTAQDASRYDSGSIQLTAQAGVFSGIRNKIKVPER